MDLDEPDRGQGVDPEAEVNDAAIRMGSVLRFEPNSDDEREEAEERRRQQSATLQSLVAELDELDDDDSFGDAGGGGLGAGKRRDSLESPRPSWDEDDDPEEDAVAGNGGRGGEGGGGDPGDSDGDGGGGGGGGDDGGGGGGGDDGGDNDMDPNIGLFQRQPQDEQNDADGFGDTTFIWGTTVDVADTTARCRDFLTNFRKEDGPEDAEYGYYFTLMLQVGDEGSGLCFFFCLFDAFCFT
jgi:hypothetical protein